VKVLRRRKFFTFISLFGISMTLLVLVIGAAVFDNVFAPRTPESRFDRVVTLNMVGWYGPQDSRTASPGYGFIERYVRPLQGIERMAVYSNMSTTGLYEGGKRYDATLRRVDGEYWRILDFRFLSGRPFTPQDDSSGALVAVITEGLGQRLFGSQPAVGKGFELDGRRFRIIGVVPRVSVARATAYAELWIPIGASRSSEFRSQELGDFNAAVLARRRDDLPRIKRQFATAIRGAKSDDPKTFTTLRAGLDTPFEQAARQLTENRQGDRAPAILRGVILLAMLLFMTLPALNLVTLNLSRILERSSEIGVRKAFGAPRTALILQFVFENVILTLLGGTIAFVLACVVMAALNHVSLIPDADFDVNLRVFGYGMLIAAFFGLFSGVYPAWKMSRLDPVNALRGGAQ
jgi:putative ABC transport system permease protein